jgi:hypothetical protein
MSNFGDNRAKKLSVRFRIGQCIIADEVGARQAAQRAQSDQPNAVEKFPFPWLKPVAKVSVYAEIRRPNPRRPKEVRNPKIEKRANESIRVSDFGLLSDFGLRVSAFEDFCNSL